MLFKLRIALSAVCASRNSQKPNPFGCPVSGFLTSLHQPAARCVNSRRPAALARSGRDWRAISHPVRRGRGSCAPEADDVAHSAEDVLERLLCRSVRNVADKHRARALRSPRHAPRVSARRFPVYYPPPLFPTLLASGHQDNRVTAQRTHTRGMDSTQIQSPAEGAVGGEGEDWRATLARRQTGRVGQGGW